MTASSFPKAALIEASLEILAERLPDPTPRVYEKLFAIHPEYQAHFWRDTNGAVKGEMLSRVFEAILDFIGPRRYADHMIRCELVTHEGYDVDRAVFATFFGHVAETVKDALGGEWTAEMAAAWEDLLVELERYALSAPGSDLADASPRGDFKPQYAAP